MRICEIVQPKTPEQQRLDSLRAASKRASDAVKQERDRQKLQRAKKTMHALRYPALNNKPSGMQLPTPNSQPSILKYQFQFGIDLLCQNFLCLHTHTVVALFLLYIQ